MSTEQIKPGYKRTELGVIPVDWSSSTIGEVCSFSGGSQPPRYTFKFTPSADYIRLIQIRDYKSDSFETYIPESLTQKRCTASDIMIGRYGPPVFQILRGIDGAYNVALIKAIPSERIDREYLFYVLKQEKLFQLIDALSRRSSGQTGVDLPALKEFGLPLPSLPEQCAIATALSDVDDLLAKLDQLIAKKRDLKQSVMQQLLTGQTRLPGFSGEWEGVTFNHVVRHHSGNSSLIKGKLSDTQAFDLFPAFSASGQDVWCDRYEHEGDAIVVSAVGSRCGKAFHASGKWTAIANTHVVWPDTNKINKQFLGFFVNDENFWLKSGSGQPFVLFKQTFARKLSLPRLPEQLAITATISSMEAELTALVSHRDKTYAVKQGMMQELLTGRIRLV